eukprot:4178637-Pyramimonas_sp.AAC.1
MQSPELAFQAIHAQARIARLFCLQAQGMPGPHNDTHAASLAFEIIDNSAAACAAQLSDVCPGRSPPALAPSAAVEGARRSFCKSPVHPVFWPARRPHRIGADDNGAHPHGGHSHAKGGRTVSSGRHWGTEQLHVRRHPISMRSRAH